MTSLNQRIQEAIQTEPESALVIDLIEAVREEGSRLATERRAVEARATDPMAVDADYQGAALALREVDLLLARNEAVLARLEAVREASEYREDQERRKVEHGRAVELVDIARVMMEAALFNLSSALKQAAEAESWARAANASLPDGFQPVEVPEIVAHERVLERASVERWCVDFTNETYDQIEGNRTPFGDRAARRWFTRETYLVRGSPEPKVRYVWDRDKNRTPENQIILDQPRRGLPPPAPIEWN